MSTPTLPTTPTTPTLRSPRLPLAFLLVAVWAAITIGGGIAQAGGTTSLDELVSSAIAWGMPGATLFLLIPILALGWARAIGLTRPTTLRPLILPALFVTAMLVLATAAGLPPTATLGILAVNSLFVGISEELAFRGVLLTPLVGRFGIRRGAIYGAIAFGAVHSLNSFVTGEVAQAVSQSFIAIGMGLWAGYLRLRTGSLYPPILLHALWDLALFAALTGGGESEIVLLSLVAVSGAVILGIWAFRSLGRMRPEDYRSLGQTQEEGYRILEV